MRVRSILLVLLCFALLPQFASAAVCNDPIRTLKVEDSQTGVPVAVFWSLGGVVPLSITISGHDFEQPVTLAPNQNFYSYVPTLPGEKHLTLTVTTDCGTFSRTVKYHVEQCNVVTPVLHLDKTSVAPGETIHASIDLLPGHTARWVVFNGTPSATTGAAIDIVAGSANGGAVNIYVYVARGSSCEVSANQQVQVVQPCSIAEPLIQTSPVSAAAGAVFVLYLPSPRPGELATFAATGATVLQTGSNYIVVIAPDSGSFSIDVTLTNATCSRTFTRSYSVTPCAPTATVSAGPGGSCNSGTLIADFTGTAPFQGYWSDGVYFFTSGTHLERTVTVGGTYTISNFIDASCTGAVTGSAQVGASLPVPQLTVDDSAGGFYYGNVTCPGLTRVAHLTEPAPAGAQIVWSVTNGTILSGQGTASIEFAGTEAGQTPISVVFRNAEGCESQPGSYPYLVTQGPPQLSVSVEPSTINAGETALVTVTQHDVTGSNVTSSLGDQLVFLDGDGQAAHYEYRSSNGGGVATITATANNSCGQSTTATATLTIDGSTTVQAKARVRGFGSSCNDYGVIAELTGVPPFTGKWNTGDTFVTWDPYAFLYPPTGGMYTLIEFSDANGPGTISGEATFDFAGIPAPQISLSATSACPNSSVTATITSPIPDGATVSWDVYGATITSGQGTGTIVFQTGSDYVVNINVRITAPGACSPYGYAYLLVDNFVQGPWFDLYGVYAGQSTDFWVTVDAKTASWNFENTLGDPMEIVGNPSPNTYIVRYTSTHGVGQSTVRVYGTTSCGTPFEASRVMNILPAPPAVALTSAQGESCGAVVTATIANGTAPYTIWWSDTGQTESVSGNTVTHFVSNSTYLYAVVSDANGATGGSDYVYVDAKILPYLGVSGPNEIAAGSTATFTAYGAPEGAEIIWWIDGANARIVSGQGTTELVIEATEPGDFFAMAKYRTAGCESLGSGLYIHVP